jgi:type II secretory pathway component PulF
VKKKFMYKATTFLGKEVNGVVEADSSKSAMTEIRSKDLFPNCVKEVEESNPKPIPPLPRFLINEGAGQDWIMLILPIVVLSFLILIVFGIDSKYREWQIKKIIKQTVQEECIKTEFKNKGK